MKIIIKHEEQTVSLKDETVLTWMDALALTVQCLQGLGYHLPKGLVNAAANKDWSDLEKWED